MYRKKIEEKCFVCGEDFKYYMTGNDFDRQTTTKNFDIYKCSSCGVEKIFPEPTYHEVMSFYSQDYYSFHINKSKKEGFNTLFEKLIHDIYNKKKRILKYFLQRWKMGIPYKIYGNGYFLDIGCGDGYMVDLFKKLGWKAYGFEIGESKKKDNIIYETDIIKANFGKIKFDFIRVAHVLEHIANPIEFLQKIKEILSPNGVVEFTLPNTKSFNAKVFGKYRLNRDIPRHLINYNINNLDILFKKQLFIVAKKRYMLGFGLLGSIKHLLKYKYKYDTKRLDNVLIRYMFLGIDFILSVSHMGDHIGFKIIKK